MSDSTDQPEPVKPADRPARDRRRGFGLEPLLRRLVVICGVVGIGVALGAILKANKTQGWEIGLIVAVVTLVLSRILWSARQR
jgi:hypothetical protein